MLDNGGVFLPEAKGTLTHAALSAIKGRTVLLGDGTGKLQVQVFEWPGPVQAQAPVQVHVPAEGAGPDPDPDPDRMAPARTAKESGSQFQFNGPAAFPRFPSRGCTKSSKSSTRRTFQTTRT